jgi:hypothetical protein
VSARSAFEVAREAPADPDARRAAIYDGAVFQLAPTEASRSLVDRVQALLHEELGDAPRDAERSLDAGDFFERIGRIRRVLYMEPRYHDALRDVVAALGEDPGRIAFDPLRLRVIAHAGEENPRAKAVYYAHRDTWYGHPDALVTWWIPLDDLPEEETFVFYPARFREPVPNDSEIFDYDAWVKEGWGSKIGWQDRNAGITVRYPGVTEEIDPGPAVGFACRRGENLLFSGAQLHRTLTQRSGRTRFSLDFRMVHLGDHESGRGAPSVDDRSRGSALPDYVHPFREGRP